MHAFAANDPADLPIPEDRYPAFAPFEHLHTGGSFYVNAVAVYPKCMRPAPQCSRLAIRTLASAS
jgi:hypothetical protein